MFEEVNDDCQHKVMHNDDLSPTHDIAMFYNIKFQHWHNKYANKPLHDSLRK